MRTEAVNIIDRGRGPQLSTCRITVQDLFPYIQQHFSHDEIRDIMPILSDEEIRVVEQYVSEHYEEIIEQDRRIRERAAKRQAPAEVEKVERQARLQRLEAARHRIRTHKSERNGDSASR